MVGIVFKKRTSVGARKDLSQSGCLGIRAPHDCSKTSFITLFCII